MTYSLLKDNNLENQCLIESDRTERKKIQYGTKVAELIWANCEKTGRTGLPGDSLGILSPPFSVFNIFAGKPSS
jgi:hypothetical protein